MLFPWSFSAHMHGSHCSSQTAQHSAGLKAEAETTHAFEDTRRHKRAETALVS
jgi:hypothetical protein